MQSTLSFLAAVRREGLLQVGDSLFNLGLAGKAIIAAITNKVNAASSDRVTDPLKSVFSSCGFCQSMRVGPTILEAALLTTFGP